MNFIKKIIYLVPPIHILLTFYRDIICGYKKYASIKREHDESKVYIQYYAGTGDVYLSASYLKTCLDNGTLTEKKGSVFVVNGKNACKVVQLFGLSDVEILEYEEKDAYALVKLARFIGNSQLDINFLHYMSDYPMYTCFWIHLAGMHGLSFWDLYQTGVFRDKKNILAKPNWKKDDNWVEKVFEEKKLKIGNTIIIAPEANSISEGPDREFWKILVKMLIDCGYQVCTNFSKPDGIAIEGTQGVFIPYEMLEAFLKRCRSFIGYRSGLCDLIATIPCKKIIIYPTTYWPIHNGLDIGTTMEIFSLKKLESVRNLYEVEYKSTNKQEVVEKIVKYICFD